MDLMQYLIWTLQNFFYENRCTIALCSYFDSIFLITTYVVSSESIPDPLSREFSIVIRLDYPSVLVLYDTHDRVGPRTFAPSSVTHVHPHADNAAHGKSATPREHVAAPTSLRRAWANICRAERTRSTLVAFYADPSASPMSSSASPGLHIMWATRMRPRIIGAVVERSTLALPRSANAYIGHGAAIRERDARECGYGRWIKARRPERKRKHQSWGEAWAIAAATAEQHRKNGRMRVHGGAVRYDPRSVTEKYQSRRPSGTQGRAVMRWGGVLEGPRRIGCEVSLVDGQGPGARSKGKKTADDYTEKAGTSGNGTVIGGGVEDKQREFVADEDVQSNWCSSDGGDACHPFLTWARASHLLMAYSARTATVKRACGINAAQILRANCASHRFPPSSATGTASSPPPPPTTTTHGRNQSDVCLVSNLSRPYLLCSALAVYTLLRVVVSVHIGDKQQQTSADEQRQRFVVVSNLPKLQKPPLGTAFPPPPSPATKDGQGFRRLRR
ncbi:hypothetical protein C8R44DRAFT_872354 [Mycena epipterygia]|nr:hypothetical protein C8R44DRAFT_872354 [Mycena epipterygia]